jgi:hypothetical protein
MAIMTIVLLTNSTISGGSGRTGVVAGPVAAPRRLLDEWNLTHDGDDLWHWFCPFWWLPWSRDGTGRC